MPIVTISTALRANSSGKQGSRHKTLTLVNRFQVQRQRYCSR
jgi:hypothetical protein